MVKQHIKKQSKFLDLWYSWLRFNKESDITRRFSRFKWYLGSYESGISRP